MKSIFGYFGLNVAIMAVAWCALVGLMSANAMADSGRGSIRAAGRSAPAARPAPAAPARAEPAHAEPARAEPAHAEPAHAAPDDHPAAHPQAPARGGAPAQRDWDDNDQDNHHAGGYAHGEPARAIRGQHMHDIPHHVAIIFDNQNYFYDDDGNYYVQQGGDYVVVQPPVGAVVAALPPGVSTVVAGPTTYYYLDGVFYVAQDSSFAVVNPPPGIVVPDLPSGATQVVANGNVYYQFNGFNYQPSIQDGVTVYTVTPM